MGKNYYKSGSNNITCDRCSKKVKLEETKKEWTGFVVCYSCFEERHPQDFVRAKQDKISVEETRPIPTLVYTDIHYLLYVDEGYWAGGYIDERI